MIKSTRKAIVAAVAVVLVALLVAGIVVGALYFFNSNYYRYRMSVFEGEYFNVGEVTDSGMTFRISVYPSNEITACMYISAYGNESERSFSVYSVSSDQRISLADVDPNLSRFVTDISSVLGNRCTLYKDKLVFENNGVVMDIVKNEYSPYGEKDLRTYPVREITYPVREIDVFNSQLGRKLSLEFNGYYTSDENISILHGSMIEFYVEENFTIICENGVEYRAFLYACYFNKMDYEKRVKGGGFTL